MQLFEEVDFSLSAPYGLEIVIFGRFNSFLESRKVSGRFFRKMFFEFFVRFRCDIFPYVFLKGDMEPIWDLLCLMGAEIMQNRHDICMQ